MTDHWQASACSGKQPYRIESAARRAAREINSRTHAVGEFVRPYRCRFCHAWHIGYLERRGRRAGRARDRRDFIQQQRLQEAMS